jgi:hypothetical protein
MLPTELWPYAIKEAYQICKVQKIEPSKVDGVWVCESVSDREVNAASAASSLLGLILSRADHTGRLVDPFQSR